MSEELPAGWEKRVSRSNGTVHLYDSTKCQQLILQETILYYYLGQAYYLNCYTKESQWDVPTKPAEPASSNGPDKVYLQ